MTRSEERRRFEAFYERKWGDRDALWLEQYPPHQVVYADSLYRRRNEHILEALPCRTGRVLDLGCGVGDVSILLADRADCVVACDLVFGNARQAAGNLVRHGVGNASTIQADSLWLPFGDETFDAVVFADVIEHIPAAAEALAEIRRVLRAGGTLICVTPVRGTISFLQAFDGLTRLMLRRSDRGVSKGNPLVYERFLGIDELGSLMKRARLKTVSQRRICFYPAPEIAGSFGGLMRWLWQRTSARTFNALSWIVRAVFRSIERVRFLDQKQLWVARR